MSVVEQTYTLEEGGVYEYNFAGSPGGRGTFLGWTDFGWLAIRVSKEDTIRVVFYNPALLCRLERV